MKTINVKFKIRFTPKLHRNPCFIRTQIIKGKVFFAPGLSLNNLETADHMLLKPMMLLKDMIK